MHEDLVKRIAALAEPSRAIDCEIGVALGWFSQRPGKWDGDAPMFVDVRNPAEELHPGLGGDALVPRFTASLDTALTLVPAGWRVFSISQNYKGWSACLHRSYGSAEADQAQWDRFHSWPRELGNEVTYNCLSAAIAVAATALKARGATVQ